VGSGGLAVMAATTLAAEACGLGVMPVIELAATT